MLDVPASAKGVDQLVAMLIVEINEHGSPVKADLKDLSRYNSDPILRAAADAAHRAIMNPHCQPRPLALKRYAFWRTMTFNFDPKD